MKVEITTLEWDAEKYQENLKSGTTFTKDPDGIGGREDGTNSKNADANKPVQP